MNRSRWFFVNGLMFFILFGIQCQTNAHVLTVGQGGFTEIQDAVDAASSGDTIFVHSGTYGAVSISNKALIITATYGIKVHTGCLIVEGIQAGDTVSIQGLSARPSDHMPGTVVRNNDGHVRFHSCSFYGADGKPSALEADGCVSAHIVNSADVAFNDCYFPGGDGIDYDLPDTFVGDGAPAVLAETSHVALYRSQLRGGKGGSIDSGPPLDGRPGGDGYRSADAFLMTSDTLFEGGKGGDGGDDLEGDTCYGRIAGNGGDGGHGIHLTDSQAVLYRLKAGLQGGHKGNGGYPGGMPGANGQGQVAPPSSVHVFYKTPGDLKITTPLKKYLYYSIDLEGMQGAVVILYIATAPGALFTTKFHGQWQLSLSDLTPVVLGVIPAGGELTISGFAPPLPPSMETLTVYVQALYAISSGHSVLGPSQPVTMMGSGY